MRKRKQFGKIKETCSRPGCDKKIEAHRYGKYRYCLACHAARMRAARPKHRDLPPEARKKANARSYVHVYIKRGKIQKLPCQNCGDKNSEAHHDDYSKPLQIIWLCRKHHLEIHNK